MDKECECWDRELKQEHRVIDSQKEGLRDLLSGKCCGPQDNRVKLRHILHSLSPTLELHLKQEESVLFPAMERLLPKEDKTVPDLAEQHRQLRAGLIQLKELLDHPEGCDWAGLVVAGQSFLLLLQDHEEKEDRFLLNRLEGALPPDELTGLARKFHEAACRACECPEE